LLKYPQLTEKQWGVLVSEALCDAPIPDPGRDRSH